MRPKPSRPTTIYDLARLAGVSAPTASKALNGRPDVGEATRRKVLDLAAKLDFTPSRMARGLAQSRSENIGLIVVRRHDIPFFSNPFYSRVLEGIEAEVAARDHNLLLSFLAVGAVDARLPKKIRERNVDGLILMGWDPAGMVDGLAERGLPVVTIDRAVPGLPSHAIQIDNTGGISEAVRRLKAAGHRRLGYVGGPPSEQSFTERRRAFDASCADLGLTAGPALSATATRELLDADFAAYLRRRDRPTAVVCANDDHAIKLMAAAASLGLSVPGDLALTGFDDIEAAALSRPGLSTLGVDKRLLGSLAVQRLGEIIAGTRAGSGEERLPVAWVPRASV